MSGGGPVAQEPAGQLADPEDDLPLRVSGSGDEERAVEVLTKAASERRTALALNAYFYGNIPLLLGLVAIAAGVLRVVLASTRAGAGPGSDAAAVGQAALLAAGAALFLAGNAIIRRQLGLGPVRLRAAAGVAALATTAVGVAAGLEAQLIMVAAVLVLPLIAEPR